MNQLWSRCSQNKPMWSKCSHQPYGDNIFRMSLGKFQMTANCYRWSNVVYMLMLHSKCCINVPIGSMSNTWSGYIWNVPNLLSAGKWWVPSTRAYNVLKMFSLVSRPPRPQWDGVVCCLRWVKAIWWDLSAVLRFPLSSPRPTNHISRHYWSLTHPTHS